MVQSFASRVVVAVVLIVAVIGPLNLAGALSSGPPAFVANAPGENNCTLCHSDYALNSGTATFSITAPTFIAPGTPHSVVVGFSGSPSSKHGFQITPVDGSGAYSGNWQVVQTNLTKNATGSTLHHEHTSLGNAFSSWTMNWIAPATLPNGPVTLYACGNQTNSSLTPSGDYIYATKRKMYQASLTTPNAAWPIGTSQPLSFFAPAHPANLYYIVPSANPAPVSFGDPYVLEVTPDWDFFFFAVGLPQVFQNIIGALDGAGAATAFIHIPFEPVLSGITLHFAGITADLVLAPTEVTNRVSITFQ